MSHLFSMLLAIAAVGILPANAEPGTLPKAANDTVPVTVDNFVRAESDFYLDGAAKKFGFGKFGFESEMTPIDAQTVIRMNRDTLYGAAVFDLDAGPVTVTLPDPGKRFMSMQLINEGEYTPAVFYGAGTHTLTKDEIGTRYVVAAVRVLADPNDPEDLKQARALQQAIKSEQPGGPGKFEIPNWDQSSQKKVRDALLVLGSTLPDFKGAFGTKEEVDPVRHLIGAAAAWGGNPAKDAIYLTVTPTKNDGTIIYKLDVKDVPVEAFWSVTVYDAKGYLQANPYNAYSLNNITAKKSDDDSVAIQFGGCDGKISNCLPIMKGWNYMVRLYRPRPEVLNGKWKFPEAQAAN
jgi:hypothetical protein